MPLFKRRKKDAPSPSPKDRQTVTVEEQAASPTQFLELVHGCEEDSSNLKLQLVEIQKQLRLDPGIIQAKDKNGRNCLHLAQSVSAFNILSKRIELLERKDGDGDLPVHVACQFDSRLDIVKLLVKHQPLSLDAKNQRGFTPFLTACEARCLSIAQHIVQKQPAALGQTDKYSNTALHILLGWKRTKRDKEVLIPFVKWLLEVRPCLQSTPDRNGNTPLLVACSNGWLSAAQYLHKRDPETLCALNRKGQTALHVVAANKFPRRVDFCRWILKAQSGDMLWVLDKKGQTPLMTEESCNVVQEVWETDNKAVREFLQASTLHVVECAPSSDDEVSSLGDESEISAFIEEYDEPNVKNGSKSHGETSTEILPVIVSLTNDRPHVENDSTQSCDCITSQSQNVLPPSRLSAGSVATTSDNQVCQKLNLELGRQLLAKGAGNVVMDDVIALSDIDIASLTSRSAAKASDAADSPEKCRTESHSSNHVPRLFQDEPRKVSCDVLAENALQSVPTSLYVVDAMDAAPEKRKVDKTLEVNLDDKRVEAVQRRDDFEAGRDSAVLEVPSPSDSVGVARVKGCRGGSSTNVRTDDRLLGKSDEHSPLSVIPEPRRRRFVESIGMPSSPSTVARSTVGSTREPHDASKQMLTSRALMSVGFVLLTSIIMWSLDRNE